MRSLVLILFLCLFCYAQSSKILVVYPLYFKSLNILGEGVVRHLLNDGHEVTFITTHPVKNPAKNLRQIDISANSVLFDMSTFNIGFRLENGITSNDHADIQMLARENAKLTFTNENVTKLLADPKEKFDAVLVDYCESEVYAGLAVLYQSPMMWVYPLGAHWQVLKLIAEPASPAYDSDYLGYNVPPFTFKQRVEELWTRIHWTYLKEFYTLPVERQIYEETFGPLLAKQGRKLPDYDEVVLNSSMIFGNEHDANFYRPSTPQNFKYIGGFHVDDPVKPLPKDLKALMDNSKHGVIYFSMGSFWESKYIPTKLTRGLLDVFAGLKETVIWKYEDDLKDLPKNVHILKWAPQQSILAHPNCKFFLTHGGLLSSIESIYFGVPIIGIPVFFDQFINMQRAVALKYAIQVDLDYDLPKNLKPAINTMLSDDSFRKNVKELSTIYHEAPIKPGPLLAHWVRHVIRTKGAPHLKSPALTVPLYQLFYLDLVALIAGILFAAFLSLRVLCKKITNCKNCKNDSKNTSAKKKQ